MDTYAEPGPSGISSYDDDNDTDMVSEECTFNSHFNLLALQAAHANRVTRDENFSLEIIYV